MCELIRAGIAGGKFAKVTSDVSGIPVKVLDFIDCIGENTQTEVCAVTSASYL